MAPKAAASVPPGLDLAPGKDGPPLAALAAAVASSASPATPPATPPPCDGREEGKGGGDGAGGDGGAAPPWLWHAETEAGRREALKLEGYMRQFAVQEQQAEKKRRMQVREGLFLS